jgi:hypothetical protein
MPDEPTTSRTRIGAAAGVAGAAAVVALVIGAGPAPSVFQLAGAGEDTSESCDAGDPACLSSSSTTEDDGGTSTSTTVDDATSTTVDDTTSTTGGGGTGTVAPSEQIRTLDAAGAGTVIYAVEGGGLRLVSATPSAGWRVEVEQSAGREVELDFRSGARRVQVNLEIEDGRVRERVRLRDDADDTDIRTEDGVVQDDHSGAGSGDGSDDDDSNSGPGSGSDDEEDRSGSNSGPG